MQELIHYNETEPINTDSILETVSQFPEVSTIPRSLIAINMHYFIWPDSISIDTFNIEDQNTWGYGDDRGRVEETLNRIITSVALGSRLQKKGYIINYINAVAPIESHGQINPIAVVEKIESELNRVLTEQYIEFHYLKKAITTKTEIQSAIEATDYLIQKESFGMHNAKLVGIIGVTSGYHAPRTGRTYIDEKQNNPKLINNDIKLLVLGNYSYKDEAGIYEMERLGVTEEEDPTIYRLLCETAITRRIMNQSLIREEKIRKVPSIILETIALLTRKKSN